MKTSREIVLARERARARRRSEAAARALVDLMASGGRHYVDNYWPSPISPNSTVGNVMLTNVILQGSGAQGRTNRTCFMYGIELRMIFCGDHSSFSSDGVAVVRVIVVYDHGNDAQPSYAANTVLVNDAFNDLYQLSNAGRISILLDETFDSVGVDTTVSASPVWRGRNLALVRMVPINRRVYFNSANTGTSQDIVSGGVYLIVWQNGGIFRNPLTRSFQEAYTRVFYRNEN